MDTISDAPPDLLIWVGAMLVGAAAAAAVLLLWQRRTRGSPSHNQAVIDAIPVDIAVLDQNGVIECCNTAWNRAGASHNPFVTAGAGEAWPPPQPNLTTDEEASQQIADAVRAVLGGAETEKSIDYSWSDGAVQQWSQVRVARRSASGGAIVIHLNTTRRQVVDAHTATVLHELAHLNMRESMGEVVSTVAHEVTQPLAASLANAQALRRMLHAPDADPDSLTAVVDDICDANRRARDIVGRIRSVMRKEPFKLEPIDLNHTVLDVVAVLNPAATADRVLVVADVDPDLPQVLADRVQVRQVVMNLVLNAVHAAREGPSGHPLVRVVTSLDGEHAIIHVEDNGPGIDSETLPRLFEPYYSTKSGGLGMGLPISRSIVESLGGSIQVSNTEAGGARFVVRLPLGAPSDTLVSADK